MRQTSAGHHDYVEGDGRMKARRILTNITDFNKMEDAKDDAHQLATRPPGPRQLLLRSVAPRVQAFKTPPKDRRHCRGMAVLRSQ